MTAIYVFNKKSTLDYDKYPLANPECIRIFDIEIIQDESLKPGEVILKTNSVLGMIDKRGLNIYSTIEQIEEVHDYYKQFFIEGITKIICNPYVKEEVKEVKDFEINEVEF